MMADELLSGAVVDAFVMGNDAPDHSQLARANTLYGIAFTLARNAWRKVIEGETA